MLDWKKIKTVFLDMDGTLLDLHYDNYFWLQHLPARYAELKSMTEQEARDYLETYFVDLKGSLKWYCFDHWADILDIDLLALKREVTHKVAYRPHAKTFLEALHAANLDVVLVTNSHRAGVEIKMEHTDLGNYISEIICSHDLGLPKENPEFWKALNSVRPYDPDTTVFFDDNEDVLRSAKAAGLIHLVSIAKPDSQKQARIESDYLLLESFLDILPKHD
jgi:putative hydrolase of the HAD superfamily